MSKEKRYDFAGADDGLDDEETESDESVFKHQQQGEDETAAEMETDATPQFASDSSAAPDSLAVGDSFTPDDIPLKFRRDNVKEFRTEHVTAYLQTETRQGMREMQRTLEDEFDETVQTLDVYEAIILSGLANPDDCLEQMRNIGYGWR